MDQVDSSSVFSAVMGIVGKKKPAPLVYMYNIYIYIPFQT